MLTFEIPGDPVAKACPRASMVVHGFARALLEVSAVATFGAAKKKERLLGEVL